MIVYHEAVSSSNST